MMTHFEPLYSKVPFGVATLQPKHFDKINFCVWDQRFTASLNSESVFLTTVQDDKLANFLCIALSSWFG
jgi:hypothetical protein